MTRADTAEAEAARASNLRRVVATARQGRPRQSIAVAQRGSHRRRREATGASRAATGRDLARNALAALLGKGPDRGRAITKPAVLQAPTPGVPIVLPSELLGHRPDVVAARWRVEAAGEGIHVSEGRVLSDRQPHRDRRPRLGPSRPTCFRATPRSYSGGPALSLPIFDGGRLRSQPRADGRRLRPRRRRLQPDAGRRGATKSPTRAGRAFARSARSSTRDAGARCRAGRVDCRHARYRAGLGTQLDVLAAQRPLLEARPQS